MEKQELEFVSLVYQVSVKGVGRRDAFTIDASDPGSVWCSSLVLDGEVVRMRRNDSEVWVPVSSVREMRPKTKAAAQPAPQPEPQPQRVAVVVPIPMPDDVTPAESQEEKRRPGRPRKVRE